MVKKKKRMGLRGKVALFMTVHTITALSLVSVIIYQGIQTERANSRWAQMHLRSMQWATYLIELAEEGETPVEMMGSPSSNANLPDFHELVSGESIGIFTSSGTRIMVLKETIEGTIPKVLETDPALVKKRQKDQGLVMMVPLRVGLESMILYCHFGTPPGHDYLRGIYSSIGKASVILVALVLLLAIAAHRIIIGPILTITGATERASEGDLDESLRVTTGDELETLARRFNHMLGRVRQMKKMALDSSPLTGLPGNNSIQRRIDTAIGEGEEVAVIYADIDSFKAYNDVYGFEAGDRAIKFTADVLQNFVAEEQDTENFVGHIGGDDFVVVLSQEEVEGFARRICDEFDLGVQNLYHDVDREAGGIEAVDREGKKRHFPFMSISLGAVFLSADRFSHFGEVSSVAAEVKKAAKAKKGSSFVVDRRSGSPVQYERHPDSSGQSRTE